MTPGAEVGRVARRDCCGVGVGRHGEGPAWDRSESDRPGPKGIVATPRPALKKQEISAEHLISLSPR